MRRSEKIRRFLESHPEANESLLQKKFGMSYREAEAVLVEYRGEIITDDQGGTAFWRGLFFDVRVLFATPQRVMITLFLIAAFWRVFYILFFATSQALALPLLDAEYYIKWAEEIISGGWLGNRVFFTEPLYAYFLALLIKLFGREALTVMTLGVQFLLGACFPALLYVVAKRYFSERVGIIAGLIAAFYGPFIFYDSLFLKTSFEVYSLPLFLLMFWQAIENPKKQYFLFAGVTLGLVTLIKGNAMVFVLLGVGLIFFLLKSHSPKQRLLSSALFTLGVLLCILPITLRNYSVSGDIVPTNYSIGLVLYQGNWWGGDGSTARVPTFLRPHPKYEETDAVGMAEAYMGRELKASEVSRFWIGKALSEVWTAPGHFLKMTGHKVLLLLNYREYSDNYSYAYYRSQIPFLWVLPNFFDVLVLGLAGILILTLTSLRGALENTLLPTGEERQEQLRRARWILLTFFLGYLAVLLMTTVNSRYRMPLIPFLIIFSSLTITFFTHRYYERLTQGVKLVLVVMVMSALLCLLPLPLFKHLSFADAYHNIGYWYFQQGDYIRAQSYFQKAVKDDSEYAWSYRSMFHIALMDGRFDDARNHLKKLLAIRADDISLYKDIELLKKVEEVSRTERQALIKESLQSREEATYDTLFYESSRLTAKGENEKGEALLRESLEKHDRPVVTLIALATLKTKEGKDSEAKEYLKEAVDKNENLLTARYNLANIYIRENNYVPVEELLKPVYELAPELGETWFNYAVTLIRANKTSEAVPVAEGYVERYQDDPLRKDKVAKLREFVEQAKSQQSDNLMNQVQQQAK